VRNPWKGITSNAVLVERVMPAWSRERCDIETCTARATRLIEAGGSVLGEFCAEHSRTMFQEFLDKLRDLPVEVGAVDPVGEKVTGGPRA